MLNVPLLEEQVQVLMAVWEQDLLSESATVYAPLDGAADGPLRALIVPKAHIAGYFDLPEKLRTACWLMVDRVHWLLAAQVVLPDPLRTPQGAKFLFIDVC